MAKLLRRSAALSPFRALFIPDCADSAALSSSDDDDIAAMETSVASVSIYRKGDQMKPFLDSSSSSGTVSAFWVLLAATAADHWGVFHSQ